MNNRFLLVGNGAYLNRGCEAIVRGTLVSLRQEFGSEIEVAAGVYASKEALDAQNAVEIDPFLRSFPLRVRQKRFSPDWFANLANRFFNTSFAGVHSSLMEPNTKRPFAALSVGGDNYSLDYGVPRHFLEMDNFLLKIGVPVFIWGASIGPFHANPEFEREMAKHLNSLDGVFVRETFSRDYLSRLGVEKNVRLMADPAFLMEPEPVLDTKIGELARSRPIGINLSPLVAKKFLNRICRPWELVASELEPFINFCVELVVAVSKKFDNRIALIPHVKSSLVGADDVYLLNAIHRKLPQSVSDRVSVVSNELSAKQLKWFIGQCRLFVGARTHSTIASLGSAVPTLSLSYSMKARGLNQDLLGTQDYCISSDELSVERIVDATVQMSREEDNITRHLNLSLPAVREMSLVASRELKRMVERGSR